MKSQKKMFVRSPDVAWQNVDDKIVVVTPRTKRIHILSGCATSIWNYLEHPQQIENIVEMLCYEYEVNTQQAEHDTDSFIRDLLNKEIVKVYNT